MGNASNGPAPPPQQQQARSVQGNAPQAPPAIVTPIIDKNTPRKRDPAPSVPSNMLRDTASRTHQLTSHMLSALPDICVQDRSTVSIVAAYNRLRALPDLHMHTCLTDLHLSFNNLRSIELLPASLVRLDLSNNKLTAFPIVICTLIHLKELSLSHTEIPSLPDEIRNCPLLEELRIDHNQISSIPASIGELGALKWLYLNNNALSALPGSIVQLSALETFEVHSNRGWLARRLGATPAAIMKRLEDLDLLTGVEYVADLKAMIDNSTFADVRLIAGDQTIDVHKFMLRRCPAFREHLAQSPARQLQEPRDGADATPPATSSTPAVMELRLEDDYDELRMLLEYVYTRRIPRLALASPSSTSAFVAIAQRYGLSDLAKSILNGEHLHQDSPLFNPDLRPLLRSADSDADLQILLSDGTRIRCHRAMLAARSDYYSCLFQSGLAESKQSSFNAPADLAPAILRTLIDWLYSSDRDLVTGDNVVELLVASDRFRVETLRSAAQSLLLAGLEADNAPYMWALARTHRAKQLEMAAVEVLKIMTWKVMRNTSTWAMLLPDEMQQLRELAKSQ